MPTTTNRGYSVPTTGSQAGIWGSDDLNPNFEKIDNNLGGVASVALSSANVTLSANEYVCGTIKFSGTLSANVTVTFPSVAGWWTVINNCTNDFYVRLSCSSGGLKICAIPGQAIDIGFDGTDAFYRSLPHHIGGYWDHSSASVPTWVSGCSVPPYLNCNAGTYSQVTYPYLFAILGTTTLPDSRGCARIALNAGTNRVTAGVSGLNGDVRFSIGGAQSVVLNSTQVPSTSVSVSAFDIGHAHTGSTNARTNNQGLTGPAVGGGGQFCNDGAGISIDVGFANIVASGTVNGGNGAHPNVQPGYVGGITMIRAA